MKLVVRTLTIPEFRGFFFHPQRLKLLPIYRVIDTAAKQLTKTAITVTAIFIVALGYDLWYYVLGYSGVIEYKMNTPLQKIGNSHNM